MTLSRTARILIAILLLAAAAFFWVNFFYRDGVAPISVDNQPTPQTDGTVPGTVPATGNGSTAQNGATPVPADGQASDGQTSDGATDVATVQGVAPAGAEPVTREDGTVVAAASPEVVTREVDIAELPFLVTEPPATTTAAEAQGETATDGAGRPVGQRVSVNPFSPIVIQAAAPEPTAPPTTQPEVTEVAMPGQGDQPDVPTMATRDIDAPAPRPLAPPAPRADGLPRQLPGGAPLAATPDLLRQPLTMPEIAPSDLGGVAAVREPGADADPMLSPVGITATAQPEDAPVEPLGPAARAATEGPDAPMAAGVDSLSRYLRDNNVVFTGSVLGPVSVGVFRSAETQMPLVVTLGQTLPETDIVLTDLTGLKAEFTLADSTQVLSLDLRR